MPLKMKDLTKLTGEAKSTILYYVKEGLLPQPQKPKPNVHLYDESCIDIIKFIKYLQASYGYSIAEIKEIFKSSDIGNGESFYMMVKALELANITKNGNFLSKDAFLKEANLSEAELNEYLEKEYIYKHKEGFGEKELHIVAIIKELKELGLEELIASYIKSAKELAKVEMQIWSKLFEDKSKDTLKEHQVAFDSTLELKPYIYNMQTLKAYYKAKGEML